MNMPRLFCFWFHVKAAAPIALASLLLALTLSQPARAQAEEAELIDRVQRLEAQVRAVTGKLEELQFRNRELDTKLQRLQGDSEFRLNALENGKGGSHPAAPAAAIPAPLAQPAAPARRSDAYDQAPATAATGAPSAGPGNLASMTPGANASAPRAAAGSPVDLATMTANAANGTSAAPRPIAGAGGQPSIVASLTPKEEYEEAARLLKANQLDAAEQSFRSFIQKNPKSPLIAEAYRNIGESFYQRRRFRDAAENYLKVTTDYANSSSAPSSLLKLGQSLAGLGEKESACAAYAELNRKYPNASPSVLNAGMAEQRRAKC